MDAGYFFYDISTWAHEPFMYRHCVSVMQNQLYVITAAYICDWLLQASIVKLRRTFSML